MCGRCKTKVNVSPKSLSLLSCQDVLLLFVCVLLLMLCGQLKPFSRGGYAKCPVAQCVQFEPDGCGATPLAQTFVNTTRVPQKQKSAFRPSRCRFSCQDVLLLFACVLLLLLCGQLKPISRGGFANCPVAQCVQFEPDGCGATPLAQTFVNTVRVPQKQKSAFRPCRCCFSCQDVLLLFVCVLSLLLCGQLKPFSRGGFANCPVAQCVQFEPDGCGATPLAQTFVNTVRVPQKQKSAFRPSRCRFSLVSMCYSFFFCVRGVTFVVW